MLCTFFMTIALFETCVVLYLHFHTREHILPSWIVKLAQATWQLVLLSLGVSPSTELPPVEAGGVSQPEAVHETDTMQALYDEKESQAGPIFRSLRQRRLLSRRLRSRLRSRLLLLVRRVQWFLRYCRRRRPRRRRRRKSRPESSCRAASSSVHDGTPTPP